MREIKFRQWLGDSFSFWGVGIDSCTFIGPCSGGSINASKTVHQQFTGLCDRNGVEIFEGDICRFDVAGIDGFNCIMCDFVGEVRWDKEDTGFFFATNTDKWPHIKPWFAKNIEVLGNRYEHPELLGGDK